MKALSAENSDGADAVAAVSTDIINGKNVPFTISSNKHEHEGASLMWIQANLSGQDVPVMIDTGATPNCIALRCVMASSILKDLPRNTYRGNDIIDANGQPLQPSFSIKCDITIGTPQLAITCEFLVFDALPFSCILGQSTLSRFSTWSVSNANRLITINDNHILPYYDNYPSSESLQLITTNKVLLNPYQSTLVEGRVSGSSLSAFRPVTHVPVVIEGEDNISNRLLIKVVPSVCLVTHQNCKHKVMVYNESPQRRTIAKGTKLASCFENFEEFEFEARPSPVMVIQHNNQDPIDMLCRKMTDLSPNEKERARILLTEYRDVFSVSNEKIGCTNLAEFDIDTRNMEQVALPLRRVPIYHREIVQKLIDQYESLGLIEPIDSPFRASTVLVKKKNVSNSEEVSDQYRICTDYRVLNSLLPKSGWPTPSVEECLDATHGSRYFSSIDFNSGYHQIPCSSRAKSALAFSPGFGFKQWTWCTMPPGVKPASGVFQRAMSKTFDGHESCILPPFYDDVIIKSSDFSSHLCNARTILEDVKRAKFTLNALKCSFFQTEIKYLGHVISADSIALDPTRISAIVSLQPPNNVKALRSFIGMVQFCSRFMCNLNVILAPLYELLRDDQPLHWSSQCQSAFDEVKSIFSSPPILYTPSKDEQFILETDASDIGIGGCLKVKKGHDEYIVGFCSKKFTESELKWNIVEKEAFAVVYNVRHFEHFLVGCRFIVRCDNRVVTNLQNKQHPCNKKLLHWTLELSEYDYTVTHIPSKNNSISDCLSRVSSISPVYHLDNHVSHVDFIAEQQNDVECAAAFQYIEQERRGYDVTLLGALKYFRKHLKVVNGILVWKDKVVVPTKLRSGVLKLCHDHPCSGHFATRRTLEKFQEKYFWPNAFDDVSNWVRSCQSCNTFNPPRSGYIKAPLQPIESDGRFSLVCYDLAGPFLPITPRGNRYALIIADHFTHWPEFVALPNIEAVTIANALIDHWCCRYGIPERFHSDGASNVHGTVIRELNNYLGINKSKSSRLHPQGDGLSEAFVKQMKSCIQKQVNKHGSDWDVYLQPTAFAIRSNTTYNSKYSPSELMLGAKLTQPVDRFVSTSAIPMSYNTKQAGDFAKKIKQRLDDSNDIVQHNLAKSRHNMKVQYDKSVKGPSLKNGQHVMLWKPYKKSNLSRCFQPNWDGPWVIESFTGPTNCKIVKLGSEEKKNVHINQLKPVELRNIHQGNTRIMSTPPVIYQPEGREFHHYLDDIDADGDNEIEVPRIVNNDQFEDVEHEVRDRDADDTLPYEDAGEEVILQDDDNVNEQNNHVLQADNYNIPTIDTGWANVEVGNIIPHRTRGLRVNVDDMVPARYKDKAGGGHGV